VLAEPQVDRLVLVADMVITARGQVKAYQFYEAVMPRRRG
jgi:ribonuclease R